MDMVDFDPIEENEEDYNLEDFFPKPLPYPIHHLIEYRIKILLKNNTVFTPGETQVVNTICMMKGKIRVAMSMHLIPFENLPLGFESGGYISQKYSGRVVIKLTNYSTHTVKLNSGTPVGYIVMQPFSLN
jgi:dUTPase